MDGLLNLVLFVLEDCLEKIAYLFFIRSFTVYLEIFVGLHIVRSV